MLVAVKVFLLCIVLDPFGQESFELPKSLASRGVEWLLAGALVISVIRYGPSIVPRSRMWAFVGAFVLANAVSALFAANTYIAIFGETDRYLGLTFVIDMTILALAVAVGYRTARDWATLGSAAAAATAIAVVYALVQFAGRDPIGWTSDVRARPFGTFGNPDIFGQFLSSAFGAALGVVIADRGARRRQALGAGVLLLLLIGAVATRGSLIGVAGAFAMALAVLAGLGHLRSIPRRNVLVGLAGILIVAAALWLSPLGRRIEGTISGSAPIEDRVLIYESAVRAVVARPLFGWGPDGFATGYPSSRSERSAFYDGANSLSSSAHDWVLQVAATTGLVGLAAYLAMLGAAAWTLLRRGLRVMPAVASPLLLALAAYLAHGLVTVGSVSVDWLPWIVVGAGASLDAVAQRAEERRRWPAFVYAAIALAALAGAGSGAVATIANHDAWFAAHNLSPARAALAERAADEATRLDGGRAALWALLGDVRAIAGRPRDAADAHNEAARRAPYVAGYLDSVALDRARQAAAGDLRDGGVDAAYAATERAISIDRYQPENHATNARIAALFGDYDKALSEASRATDLYPFGSGYDELVATNALKVSDKFAARDAVQKVIVHRETATLRVALATLDLALGDRASAIVHVKRALVLDPNNADAKRLAQQLGL